MTVSDDEYESLPKHSSPSVHLLAGAMAGISEHCIMYPFDSIKTRMQMNLNNSSQYNSITASFRSIVQQSGEPGGTTSMWRGLARLWRGMPSVFFGAGPAHALYFATYEQAKHTLVPLGMEGKSPIATSAAGVLATMVNEAFMNPFDTIKQRMQADTSIMGHATPFGVPKYRNIVHCLLTVVREEGVRALYLSYPTTLLLNLPFQGLQFPLYEAFRRHFNPSGQYSPATHILAGSLAGAIASAATTPVDNIKTMLQTRGVASDVEVRNVRGMRHAVHLIYRLNGLAGFWRGWLPRLLTNMPATAVCWTTYEYFKYLLSFSQHVVVE